VPTREQRVYGSSVHELRRISTWWREWAASAALSPEAVDRGELCLNELVANIVQHGGEVGAIEIALEAAANTVRITIADDGQAFDPVAHAPARLPRTLDEAGPGGLGIHIVRSNTAGLSYDRVDGWNRLTLTLMP
jgi:serine/threonine-protein kinase RsbW